MIINCCSYLLRENVCGHFCFTSSAFADSVEGEEAEGRKKVTTSSYYRAWRNIVLSSQPAPLLHPPVTRTNGSGRWGDRNGSTNTRQEAK